LHGFGRFLQSVLCLCESAFGFGRIRSRQKADGGASAVRVDRGGTSTAAAAPSTRSRREVRHPDHELVFDITILEIGCLPIADELCSRERECLLAPRTHR